MSNFVVPSQTRFIDSYSLIFENNKLNKHCDFALSIKDPVIVDGLDIQLVDNHNINVTSGSCIIDHVYIEIQNTQVNLSDTSFSSGTTNYVVVRYQYQLVYPPTKAYIDVSPTYSIYDLLLGFIDIDSTGNITNVSYNHGAENRSPNIWRYIIDNISVNGHFVIDSDLNMNNHKIIHVADPILDTDGVNKRYVDNNTTTGNVFVNSDDQNYGFLVTKIQAGENITIIDNNSKLRFDVNVSADMFKKKVISADSGCSFIRGAYR